MARKKEYIEDEVIEKAMNLFWRNGYKTTSMQMLEKEMGINKFSIYSSFGNKNGVFLECIKCYRKKSNILINNLKASENGIAGIKQYFYEFIEFTKETEFGKGCLVTNTTNEIGVIEDENVIEALSNFSKELKNVFINNIKQSSDKNKAVIEQQSDYLIIAMFGLSSATRIFNKSQLTNYIENVFKRI